MFVIIEIKISIPNHVDTTLRFFIVFKCRNHAGVIEKMKVLGEELLIRNRSGDVPQKGSL